MDVEARPRSTGTASQAARRIMRHPRGEQQIEPGLYDRHAEDRRGGHGDAPSRRPRGGGAEQGEQAERQADREDDRQAIQRDVRPVVALMAGDDRRQEDQQDEQPQRHGERHRIGPARIRSGSRHEAWHLPLVRRGDVAQNRAAVTLLRMAGRGQGDQSAGSRDAPDRFCAKPDKGGLIGDRRRGIVRGPVRVATRAIRVPLRPRHGAAAGPACRATGAARCGFVLPGGGFVRPTP